MAGLADAAQTDDIADRAAGVAGPDSPATLAAAGADPGAGGREGRVRWASAMGAVSRRGAGCPGRETQTR